MATLRVGTSGYAYKPWKGSFYPEKLPDKEMLAFYATRFRTVEINFTFYRMPVESMLQKWAEQVPAGFQFAMKANQQITHIRKLRDVESTLRRFLEVASVLQEGDRLGPVLVQLPPTFKADFALLDEFLQLRPRAFRLALEVRHPSWHTPELYDVLRRHETALCLAETDEKKPAAAAPGAASKGKGTRASKAKGKSPAGAPPVTEIEAQPLGDAQAETAGFVYLRLRKENYTAAEIAAWRARCDTWLADGRDVYAYFKHEDEGKAPAYADQLLATS